MTIRLLAVNPTGLTSGAEKVLLTYLAAARDHGIEPLLAAPAGPLSDAAAAVDVPVAPLPFLQLRGGPLAVGGSSMAATWMVASRRLRRLAAGADIVLANGVFALVPLRMANLRIPVAWLVHDVLESGPRAKVMRLGLPGVDVALAVSRAAAAPIEALGGTTVVVPNGTRWPVDAARPQHEPLLIGQNALLTPWKGHTVTLEAIARLDREVVLELLGGQFPKDADHVAALQRRAAAPDLAGRVRFVGHVSDPLEHMRRWSIAVISSTDPEAAPLAALEAMSIGLPVVGTAIGGTVEELDDAGVLVPPGDPDALAAALAGLVDDADRRRTLGDAARARVEACYRQEEATARFFEAVHQIVPHHKRAAR